MLKGTFSEALDGIDLIPITDANIHVVAQARARLVECEALVAIATSDKWPFSAVLMPLTRAIDDSIRHIEKKNHEPVDEATMVDDWIQQKEICLESLDQARVTAVQLLTHLDRALTATLKSSAVKPTNG